MKVDEFKKLPNVEGYTIGSIRIDKEVLGFVLKNKKGQLYQEPFINFRDSRNRCLELANNSGIDMCQFNIMLDDTYILKGNVRGLLQMIRSDEFADSFNVMIQSDDVTYGSTRITKSNRGLQYIYKIHEVIQQENNISVELPFSKLQSCLANSITANCKPIHKPRKGTFLSLA